MSVGSRFITDNYSYTINLHRWTGLNSNPGRLARSNCGVCEHGLTLLYLQLCTQWKGSRPYQVFTGANQFFVSRYFNSP